MKVCMAKFNPNVFLECHINDAINVLKSIKIAFPWFGEVRENFWELLFYSIILHDIGKCAMGFQRAGASGKIWGYRHEILSTAFTQFLNYNKEERNLIALAILTHHKYLDDQNLPTPTKNVEIIWETYLDRLEELLKNSDYIEGIFVPKIPYWEIYVFGKTLGKFKIHKDWVSSLRRYDFDELLNWYYHNWKKYSEELAFLKGLLNACDHLSSAGENSVKLLPSIRETLALKIPEDEWRPMQKKANQINGNLLLRAPTGYGKTEAALLWADKNSYKSKNKISNRIFYILPYKASINAMYERMLEYFKSPEVIGVLHSSSSYYLFSSNLEYKRLSSLYQKIFSPLKVTTPFQLMKAFFGVGFFEMTLSELKNSLLIFDEIHAYEPNILGIILAILELLKKQNVKVLIMSATLPNFIENLFKKSLNPKELKILNEEADIFTRHRVEIIDGDIIENIDEFAKKTKKSGDTPAVIACNTVDRAKEVYRVLKDTGYRVMLIHSRFTYGDREELERKVKGNTKGYDFVVATQVIEVSLDISFKTILSEPAPLDALIQRFGRVNRQGWRNKKISNVYVLTKGSDNDEKIYKPYSVVKESLEIIGEFDGKILRESKIPELVSRAYSEIEEVLIKEVEKSTEIALSLFKDLEPLKKSESEEEFYKMFQGLEIVPIKYYQKAVELVEKGRGIEVHRYLVPISYWKYLDLQNKLGYIFDYDPKYKIIVANLKYDPRIGLIDEIENMGEIL